MKVYQKLVRDKIPEIITQEGKYPETEILNDEMYFKKLCEKLIEETNEYLENYDVNELCDILEVVYALANYHGISKPILENMRKFKEEKRGAFQNKILLKTIK